MADFRRFWFRLGRFVSRTSAVRRREKSGSFDRESTGKITRLIPGLALALDETRLDAVRGVAECYRNNLFDILGSGWIEASPGVSCRGFRGHRYAHTARVDSAGRTVSDLINESNRSYSQQVRQLIDGDHRPIDWQRDYKSGFHWDSKAPSNDAQIGEVAGSDIKVPWELSKLQHLPQLAVAFATGPSQAEGTRYVSTFQNQLLDFIASNPPGYGAGWYTAMLAGIRAANILVSFDLFRAYGASFTAEFEHVVLRTIMDHARFIVGNLDWWVDDQRNNHFVANIAGLAAICAFVPESDETNDMLALVLRALESEVDAQFTKDGGSVEGSTAYHAFSGEMMAWACLFVQSIPTERRERASKLRGASLPKFARSIGWSRMRVDRAEPEICRLIEPKMKAIAFFFEDTIDAQRRIVQIGDNDSGRFLKILPSFERLASDDAIMRYASLDGYAAPMSLRDYWDEDLLNYAGVGSVLDAVCRTSFDDYTNEIEYQLTAGLLRMAAPESWSVDSPKRNWQLLSGRTSSEQFRVSLTNTAMIGEYEVPLHFDLDTIPAKRITVYRQVTIGPEGIDVETKTRLLNRGELQVRIVLTNRTDSSRSFVCYLFPPPGRQFEERIITLAPGATVRRDFYWSDVAAFIGKEMKLRAEEQDSPRVINYRFKIRG